jgi:hypothetical protein
MTASLARDGNLGWEEQAIKPTPTIIASNKKISALYFFEFMLISPMIKSLS